MLLLLFRFHMQTIAWSAIIWIWAVSAKDNNKHVHLAFQTYKWNAANTKKKILNSDFEG